MKNETWVRDEGNMWDETDGTSAMWRGGVRMPATATRGASIDGGDAVCQKKQGKTVGDFPSVRVLPAVLTGRANGEWKRGAGRLGEDGK